MKTPLRLRILGDLVGCVTLIALTLALAAAYFGADAVTGNWPTIAGAILFLTLISYRLWIQFERPVANWRTGVLVSIGLGVAFFLIDILIGELVHPNLNVIRSATSTMSFGLTLLVCPLGTLIFVAGWARSIILRSHKPSSGRGINSSC
jgi:hypothetical protein